MMKLRSGLDLLKPYSIDEAEWPIKLDANEKAENLPPAVAAALTNCIASMAFNRYPEIAAKSLRTKLAGVLNRSIGEIQVGNGSSELLEAICRAFGGPGRRIVYPVPSFSMYPVYIQLSDSNPVPVKLGPDYSFPFDEYLAEGKKADLVILCNPNNPTGNSTPIEMVARLASELSCPIVVDEAYFEFHKESALELLDRYQHLIIVRTFSKAYGLAAARVGYLAASEAVSTAVSKVMLPYHLNALSLAAAETVLDHRGLFTAGIDALISERKRLSARLASIEGITVYPSATNFLLVRVPQADRLVSLLTAAGIGIRDFSRSPELEDCLRITVGSPAENNSVIDVFEKYSLSAGKEQE